MSSSLPSTFPIYGWDCLSIYGAGKPYIERVRAQLKEPGWRKKGWRSIDQGPLSLYGGGARS